MSWIITGTEKNPVDPYFGNVSLLLHGDGVNGSTTIVDSSPTPKTVTAVGNAQISTAQSKFGGSSIFFDGTGDYLTVAYNSSLDITSGDFTLESWIWRNVSSANQGILSSRIGTAGMLLSIDANKLVFALIAAGITVISSANVPTEQWSHVACTRNQGQFKLFIDGILSGDQSSQGAGIPSSALAVGSRDTVGNNTLNGYIDDLRITKGIARYTSNFTPPTAPFPDI